eukprot:COSAG01_NODE_508_length_16107_cov_120.001187_10_plen_630_part_00
MKEVAAAMQRNGMQAAGYNLISLDDCWVGPNRTSEGELTWDRARFPAGIPELARWLQHRDFQLGIYTSAGSTTCTGLPGSRYHYLQDTATFARWGVSYLKLDWCGDIKDEVWQGAPAHRAFSAAMNKTGHAMFLSVVAGYFFLGPEVSFWANSWRFCVDHHDSWQSTREQMLCRVDLPLNGSGVGAPGGWPDMDYLHVGGAGCAASPHCAGADESEDSYLSQFVIWSLTQSPLIVDTDVRYMTAAMNDTLLNKELLALHNSTTTPPGRHLGYSVNGGGSLWGRAVLPDDWVVALQNTRNQSTSIPLAFEILGWSGSTMAKVKDVMSGDKLPVAQGMVSALVQRHGVRVLRLSRVTSDGPIEQAGESSMHAYDDRRHWCSAPACRDGTQPPCSPPPAPPPHRAPLPGCHNQRCPDDSVNSGISGKFPDGSNACNSSTVCVKDVLPGCSCYRGDSNSQWGLWCEDTIAAFDRNKSAHSAPENIGGDHPIYYFRPSIPKPRYYVLYLPPTKGKGSRTKSSVVRCFSFLWLAAAANNALTNAALPISATSGRYEYFLFQYLKSSKNIGVFVVQAPVPDEDFWDHVPQHNVTSPYNYSCKDIKSGYIFCQQPCDMCTKPRSTRLIEAAVDKAGE